MDIYQLIDFWYSRFFSRILIFCGIPLLTVICIICFCHSRRESKNCTHSLLDTTDLYNFIVITVSNYNRQNCQCCLLLWPEQKLLSPEVTTPKVFPCFLKYHFQKGLYMQIWPQYTQHTSMVETVFHRNICSNHCQSGCNQKSAELQEVSPLQAGSSNQFYQVDLSSQENLIFVSSLMNRTDADEQSRSSYPGGYLPHGEALHLSLQCLAPESTSITSNGRYRARESWNSCNTQKMLVPSQTCYVRIKNCNFSGDHPWGVLAQQYLTADPLVCTPFGSTTNSLRHPLEFWSGKLLLFSLKILQQFIFRISCHFNICLPNLSWCANGTIS